MGEVSFAATGDSLITRRLPARDEHFLRLAGLIKGADVRFTNLETVIRTDEGFPAAESGGTWTSSPPAVLADLQAYGFNVLNLATNHTLDYSYGGLKATLQYIRQYGFVSAGAGANLAEASAPQYVESPGGRVALVAATATCPASWVAGDQRRDMPGRPGVNALRYHTVYRVSRERLQSLKSIAQACQINLRRELSIKNGFVIADPPHLFRFGDHLFAEAAPGEKEGLATSPDPRDVKRIFQAIDEAKRQADIVLVSIHTHEIKDGRNDLAADFVVEFARACIDRGAHGILGHGPHIVRGIEVYKDRPVFYGLGNFIFQSDTVAGLPADYYEKYGLGPDHTTADALDERSAGDTRGYARDPKIWSSVVAEWKIAAGALTELTVHPITLGFGQPRYRRGWPRLTHDVAVLQEVQEQSKVLGTRFEITGAKAVWRPR